MWVEFEFLSLFPRQRKCFRPNDFISRFSYLRKLSMVASFFWLLLFQIPVWCKKKWTYWFKLSLFLKQMPQRFWCKLNLLLPVYTGIPNVQTSNNVCTKILCTSNFWQLLMLKICNWLSVNKFRWYKLFTFPWATKTAITSTVFVKCAASKTFETDGNILLN